MLPFSLLAGGLSAAGSSSTDAGTQSSSGSQQAGYTTSHVINDTGTGFKPSATTIAIYVGLGLAVLVIAYFIFRRRR